MHEGILRAVLAAGMILVFLGSFRSTVIAVVTIPLALLTSIAGLLVTDNSINAMTLGGMALAIGPLVDNAIVVLENTHRHLTMGKPPAQAALDAAQEVALPVMVATLTTIIVLVPIAFSAGHGPVPLQSAGPGRRRGHGRVVWVCDDPGAMLVRRLAGP